MSDTKRYFLHCDYPSCNENIMGDVDEPPSRIRRRYSAKQVEDFTRWAAIKLGENRYKDLCPTHAQMYYEQTRR